MPKIFRGFSQLLEEQQQLNIFYHKPRAPQNTDSTVHEIADLWFFRNFGALARSRSLICTTDFTQARSYGALYQIIPESPTAIIYSPLVKDFYEHHCELDDYTEPNIIRWLETKKFVHVESTGDIDPNFLGEVMVMCEKYRAIRS
ncbi:MULTISPECIES: hypothetical protein [Pseudomonas]|uniref:hypothetical protein n=1 Tax=Pseudomonas TaxID=286 RepID=UPI0011C40F57|nr:MULTISPECIES: hypothetical protein [Pseudomonas]MCO7058639.1 hypothetical protein [Pseudomonas juntendi]UJM14941.1 hypothetical protein L1P09_12540 [Pseudomonas juntendi]UXA36422.1 hypothetical protein KZA81_12755 [Pseudomonas juntendi]